MMGGAEDGKLHGTLSLPNSVSHQPTFVIVSRLVGTSLLCFPFTYYGQIFDLLYLCK